MQCNEDENGLHSKRQPVRAGLPPSVGAGGAHLLADADLRVRKPCLAALIRRHVSAFPAPSPAPPSRIPHRLLGLPQPRPLLRRQFGSCQSIHMVQQAVHYAVRPRPAVHAVGSFHTQQEAVSAGVQQRPLRSSRVPLSSRHLGGHGRSFSRLFGGDVLWQFHLLDSSVCAVCRHGLEVRQVRPGSLDLGHGGVEGEVVVRK